MKFVSQYESFHLTIESRREIREGREVTITPGLAVQFKDGVFETKDKELINKLKSAPNYRKDFGPERTGTKKEKAVAPKSRASKASKSPIAKESKKSAKLNKEAVKSSE